MLEQLYNIVKNGSSCGVQTFIHFDEGAIRNSSSTTYVDLLAKIRENCICLQAGSDGWHSDDGTSWAFNTAPSQKTMADFSELYGSKYAEVTSSILPITKIIPEDIWFTGDSSALFSVPIGKDENGTVQYLEFGDPVSKGTSHHALVTGSLGSGKSTLLHTIIMSALTTYSPDELNLYLLDFKSGTEFQVYANHKIPHIKVLALDAMQEFGQSVLDELIGMMQKRLDMFTEETQKGYPVKDITSYRKYTGKKMPRILVVADEFQVLFSEAHNRRVANTCATRLADIISLYRVCGIHFILATQTMSRLRNGFTVSPSTLSEMHVRIGLKCSESECNLLFGGTNAKAAFDKMIKADELREFRPVVRYRDGNQITLQTVQEAIKDCAQGMGIPVAFYTDQVKSGGMFNKTIEDCIVLYHPEHQYDYFKICVRVSHQGSYAFVSAMDFGTSKQMKKAGQAEAYRADRKGKSMSYKVGSMIGQGLTSIGRSKSKLEEEQNYYACIIDIFDEIVS